MPTLLLIGVQVFALLACGRTEEPRIERLRDHQRLSGYRLTSFGGDRDGESLSVQIVFESPETALRMELHFRVGVPTRLAAGRYRWKQEGRTLEGPVADRSVTFLGGQSDRPSLGGVFELLSAEGTPVYRVTVPTAPLTSLRRRTHSPTN